jgi:hypothetical protein
MSLLASCADAQSPSHNQINSAQFSSKASFARKGYIARYPITDSSGKTVFEVSCYSLDENQREKFAQGTGTDPVADLSCYVKDISRKHEYTMLGIEGESLQFTPAFFWLAEIGECNSGSYRLKAAVRGVEILFIFSNINVSQKSADLAIDVKPMASATNVKLTEQSYKKGCM